MGWLIAVEKKETHAVIRLDRPEKKNAMNRAARRELLGTLAALQGHRAIVLTGTGDSFCAGVDLKESRADAQAGTPPEPASDWIEVNLAIRRHPAIFIAAVNGLALGGGATLVTSAARSEPPRGFRPAHGVARWPADASTATAVPFAAINVNPLALKTG